MNGMSRLGQMNRMNQVMSLKNEAIKPPEEMKPAEDIKPVEEIRLPELKIQEKWKPFLNWISRIPHYYWIIFITIILVTFSILMPYQIWIDFWSFIKSQGILVSMLLIFSLIALSLVWSTGQRIDVWVFMHFNMRGQRAPWLDWFMLGFTQMGSGFFALTIALVLFLKVNHLLAYELTFGILTLWLVVELMKVVFHRTRPYLNLKSIRIVGSRASGHSFPSGHTSQSFFIATFALHYLNLNVYVSSVLYVIAFLVGVTRIYVGMHYPRDVLGGAILGTFWGLFGVIVNQYIWIVN
jgi:membrane-associated phospholipid phosphatase